MLQVGQIKTNRASLEGGPKLIVTAEDLCFSYGNHAIIEEVSFNLFQGDYVALVGPNGGGKTTLVKLLLGLLKPDSGSVTLFDGKGPKGGQIGYIPQIQGSKVFDFPANVFEVVKSGLGSGLSFFKGLTAAQKDKIASVMELCGVTNLKDQLIGELSGGQRQRVFIARALVDDPALLILDEPTAGVDPPAQERFYNLLNQLNLDLKMTLLFISHDVGVMSEKANRFLCLNKNIHCHESPENFLKEEFMDQVYGNHLSPITHRH
ncbi:MAG: metal ABC transporter ATP-binding protein [SAR324 cluster bacterium]|nr:metal ABC transporter ATP-binding protein [SAR324 cluster bacterium]